jgi:hypothetical protein
MRQKILFAFLIGQLMVLPQTAGAAPAEKSVYADLLPANTKLQDSPDRLDPVLLQNATLGVIASSRYIKRTERWQKWFGEKGERSPRGLQSIMGLSAANKKLGAEASDPKRLADAALLVVKPRFGKAEVFDDLASARDGGANYFLILDFTQSVPMNFGFGYPPLHGWAGALLLDGSFRRIAEVAVDKKSKWFSVPLLGMSNAYMMAFAKSHDENFNVLLPAFASALDAALTARGSPMPAAAPVAPPVIAAAAAPAAIAPVDQAYLAELAAIPTAGALFALGDEMAEKGELAKAKLAFRAILNRFPNDVLAAKAADRLSSAAR